MQRKLKTLPLSKVKIKESFLGSRAKVVRENTIPYQWEALNDLVQDAEPSYAVRNFRIVAGEVEGEYGGRVFQDSDVYKWLEAVGFYLEVHEDPEIEEKADYLIDLIEKAQEPDGYINTYYTLVEPENRWTNLRENHELYCAGHMIEAAVAYYKGTGKRKFLDIACRFADYIHSVFGYEPDKKRGYPGHEEIELALVKLYDVTKNKKYLDLSSYFIEERGKNPHYFDLEAKKRTHSNRNFDNSYYQAHLPVREQETAEGHAVRAVYLYSGITDIAAETGDEELFAVCKRIWKNVLERRMYIHGGIGSIAYGEAFTFDYDLPNDIAYAETCAAIGLVFWASRMLQCEPDREYSDVIERALYNGILSGISLDGTKYFYVNPLEIWPERREKRNDRNRDRQARLQARRQGWWGTACCPPNIARLMGSLGQYIYSYKDNEVYVHLYLDNETEFEINGQNVVISQKTNYPWDENIRLVVQMESELEFTLALRIPGWCRDAKLMVNGKSVDINDKMTRGYALVKRLWKQGDDVTLRLAMPVERIQANPEVRDNVGKVALQRGPVLYCLEEVDHGKNVFDITLPRNAEFSIKYDPDLLGGVSVISTTAYRSEENEWKNTLYKIANNNRKIIDIQAVPYFAWANRAPGEMVVWIKEC